MKPFTKLDAKAAPLPLANIDTDQIIPCLLYTSDAADE